LEREEFRVTLPLPFLGQVLLLSAGFLVSGSICLATEVADPRAVEFFESRIRPILSKHCYECHSARAARLKGGLLLDSRAGLRQGGDSGPVLVPGSPAESLLIQALKHQGKKMPPRGKLPDEVVADFIHWIEIGAPDPRTETVKLSPTIKGKDLWSLQPITRPVIPTVQEISWPRNAIDCFIQSGLEARGMTPTRDAEPHALLRRLHYVLTGLPPTPEQLETFEKSYVRSPQFAIAKVVDDLVASPYFGQRWARHWLDLARYADVSGSTAPASYPEAWRYREYVIHAFNTDKPFDRFVREQLAGDLLPASSTEERAANLIATGYLALFHIVAADRDPEKRKLDVVDEQLDVLGKNFLGIAVGCARCHDHKLDPLPARDYYALAGIFRSTANVTGGFGTSGSLSVPLPAVPATASAWMQGDRVKVLAVQEEASPQDVALRIGGDVEKKGALIPRGFPALVPIRDLEPIPAGQSGRLQLAEWLLHPDNPLMARVIVNRVWHHLFGQGLVRSTDNFGTTGDTPSHPELLDYLALRFREHHRWSFKSFIRELLLTRAWQLSAQAEAGALAADPDNRWLGRANRRRQDAEALHDALFLVAGRLDLAPAAFTAPPFAGGNQASTVNLAIPEEVLHKRAVYWPVFRKDVPVALDMLGLFDMPVATSPRGTRAVSVVPTQGLFLLNSPMVLNNAEGLSARLQADASLVTDSARVEQLYLRLFARKPDPDERARALRFVQEFAAQLARTGEPAETASRRAWMRLCHSLLISTEFLVVN
jgi:hypothetical protein